MRNQSVAQKRRRGRKRLRLLIAVGSIIALFVLAMLIDSALYYNKVHAGVSISGHNMGGLTRDEATATLTNMVEKAEKNPIVLTSGDKKWKVMPGNVGTKIDVTSAVSAAMDVSRKSNFLVDLGRRFTLYFSDRDIPLQGTVNNASIDGILARVAQELDIPP